MKGQVRIEFIFGIVIFILVIVLVVTQTNTLYSSLLGDSRKDALKAKAINVIDILVEDPGYPSNWDIQSVPVDVVLVNDISASMDGKANVYPYFNTTCRKQCNLTNFQNGGNSTYNGCNKTLWGYNVTTCNPGVSCSGCNGDWCDIIWTDPNTGYTVPVNMREVWPYCADCDKDGGRADVNETGCPIWDSKVASIEFVNQLNETDRSALVLFDSDPYLIQGLTNNTSLVKNGINNYVDFQGSTRIEKGIDRATLLLSTTGNHSSKWVEILVTDGRDETPSSAPIYSAINAGAQGIAIYTIGFDPTKNYINETQLKEIADITGGEYFYSPNASTVSEAYLEIAQRIKLNVTRIGLAQNEPYNPYNISQNKVSRLYNNCNFLSNFDLGAYRLKIYNSTGNQVLFCGYDSLEPPAVMETRYVYIKGDFGKVTLELW